MAPSPDQTIVQAKNEIARLKQEFMASIAAYVTEARSVTASAVPQMLTSILSLQHSGTAYFNYVEELVGNSHLLGAEKSAIWSQGFAEDCSAVLGTMPQYFELLAAAFARFAPDLKENWRPEPTAFANMQRLVMQYLGGKATRKLRADFKKAKLPTFGFDNPANEFMNTRLKIILAFVFGVIFLLIIFATAIVLPNPTPSQHMVFRTILALAGAGFATVLSGFLEINMGNWLRAGGALAVFVALYFFTPALLPDAAQPVIPVQGTTK